MSDWHKKGICVTKGIHNKYFFDAFEEMDRKSRIEFLSETCDICPVRNECREYGLNNRPDSGLYGGIYWRNSKPIKPTTMALKNIEKIRDKRHQLTRVA